MPLAARGYYTFFVGQSGATDAGVGNAGTSVAYPVTGLMVMGGAQGGSGGATASAGGGYTCQPVFPSTISFCQL